MQAQGTKNKKADRALCWANFRCLEVELSHYHQTKKELQELRLAIIEGGGQPDVFTLSGPNDITARKAVKLVDSTTLREMERRVKAIEWALGVVERTQEPARLKLIQMKYFEKRLTDVGIQEALSISSRTFRRWKKEFIGLVAERLGWRV